jgi:hypothetical protein
MNIISSSTLSFPSGSQARRAAAHKCLDVMYAISKRIGFEDTRRYLTGALKAFFDAFNIVHNRPMMSSDAVSEADSGDGGTVANTPSDDTQGV